MYQCKGYEMLTGYEIHYFGFAWSNPKGKGCDNSKWTMFV